MRCYGENAEENAYQKSWLKCTKLISLQDFRNFQSNGGALVAPVADSDDENLGVINDIQVQSPELQQQQQQQKPPSEPLVAEHPQEQQEQQEQAIGNENVQ